MKKSNKEQMMFNYIKETTDIAVSKKLLCFIFDPNRLTMINNTALKSIVIEYAPIFKKYRNMLDGPFEQSQISRFSLILMCRIENKPELKSILGIQTEPQKS